MRSSRRRQEFAGPLSVEFYVQDQRDRYVERSRDEPGQVGKTRTRMAAQGVGTTLGRRDRSDAVCQIRPLRTGARHPVSMSQFFDGRFQDRPASLAGVYLYLQCLPAEEPW